MDSLHVFEDDTTIAEARFRVLLEHATIPNRWSTVESFTTEREANAFLQGFTAGALHARVQAVLSDPCDECGLPNNPGPSDRHSGACSLYAADVVA